MKWLSLLAVPAVAVAAIACGGTEAPAQDENIGSTADAITAAECAAQMANLDAWRKLRAARNKAIEQCWNEAAWMRAFCPYPNAINLGQAARENCQMLRNIELRCEQLVNDLNDNDKTEPRVDADCGELRQPVPVVEPLPVPVTPRTEPILSTECRYYLLAGACVCLTAAAAIALAPATGGLSLCAVPAH